MTTPIGIDATVEERVRMFADDVRLPRLEHDTSRVFSARPVLWKYRGPMLRIAPHDDKGMRTMRRPSSAVRWQHRGDRGNDALDDVALVAMQENPQGVRTSVTADVAITEVHPKKIRVRRTLVLVVGVEPTLNRF
jgi:hypothetical protein